MAKSSKKEKKHKKKKELTEDKKKKKKKKKVKKEQLDKSAHDELTEKLIHGDTKDAGDEFQGEVQQPKCRDPAAAGLFFIQLIVVIVIAYKYGAPVLEKDVNGAIESYGGYLTASATLSIISLFVGLAAVRVMLNYGKSLIKFLLFFCFALGGILVFTSTHTSSSVFGVILILVVIVYGRMTWNRIPLATENLVTAISGLKANFGVFYLCFFYVVVVFFWTLLWILSLIGANELTKTCVGNGPGQAGGQGQGRGQVQHCTTDPLIFIPYGLSYFWVFQTVLQCVVATSAGVIREWWHQNEGTPGCIKDGTKVAFREALTTKFGSICWGALLTPYVQTLNEVINPDGDMETGITECFPKSCVSMFERAVDYFNQWGFVYVGLYGYKFGESSKKVQNMIKETGWTPVTSDHLLRNIFILSYICVGLIMMEVGHQVANSTDWFGVGNKSADIEGRVMGFIIGIVFGSILLTVITGAVLTVIVLFAERHEELEEHHPDIFDAMDASYRKAYPNIFL